MRNEELAMNKEQLTMKKGKKERHNSSLFLHFSLFIFHLSFVLFACGQGVSESVSATTPRNPFVSFRAIPGVTHEEIAAVEAIMKQSDSFTYGMTPSSEAFYRDDGEVRGFTAFFTAWLSQLFGVLFKPEIYPWGDLINGLETGDIDFAGNLTASAERRKTYCMTDAIARRSMRYLRLVDSLPLAEIANTRPLCYAFLN
jgi:ABC-type amino acid transport substrate-binding protein